MRHLRVLPKAQEGRKLPHLDVVYQRDDAAASCTAGTDALEHGGLVVGGVGYGVVVDGVDDAG